MLLICRVQWVLKLNIFADNELEDTSENGTHWSFLRTKS